MKQKYVLKLRDGFVVAAIENITFNEEAPPDITEGTFDMFTDRPTYLKLNKIFNKTPIKDLSWCQGTHGPDYETINYNKKIFEIYFYNEKDEVMWLSWGIKDICLVSHSGIEKMKKGSVKGYMHRSISFIGGEVINYGNPSNQGR